MTNEQTLAWMVPAIIALTYLAKGRVRDEALPVIATAVGFVLTIGWTLYNGDSITNDVLILGVIAAGTAQGGYAGVKTLARGAGLGARPDPAPAAPGTTSTAGTVRVTPKPKPPEKLEPQYVGQAPAGIENQP